MLTGIPTAHLLQEGTYTLREWIDRAAEYNRRLDNAQQGRLRYMRRYARRGK